MGVNEYVDKSAIPTDALSVKKLRSSIDIHLNYKLDKISQDALLYTPHGIRKMCPINELEHFEIHNICLRNKCQQVLSVRGGLGETPHNICTGIGMA